MGSRKLSYLNIVLMPLLFCHLSSCCRTEKYMPGYLQLAVVNFSRQESDTIVIRQFKINTGFSQKIDSFLLARGRNSAYTDFGPDTSFIVIFQSNPFDLTVGNDYELYFPATGTLKQISNITENMNEQKVCLTTNGRLCYNDVISLRVDGMPGIISTSNRHAIIRR
jgi:hypothetical protein